MKTSDAGVALIKKFEGLRLNAYPDPGSGGEPWTIGYGSTRGVKPGDTITEAEADAKLRDDLFDSERCVDLYVTVPLTRNQHAALVSFVFNLGCGNFASSTMLGLLNAGDYQGASHQFARWNRASGRVLTGLVLRRDAERQMFNQGDTP